MRVTLGMFLDGPHFPDLLGGRSAVVGEAVVGPMGFLGLLETRLGLVGPVPSEPLRVARYAAMLEKADTGTRFYSASFAVDRVGVSRTLLRWRDELRGGGWSPATVVEGESRLHDLASVESVDRGGVASGTAERQRQVAAALERRSVQGLSSIRLVESQTEWPGVWRSILSALANSGVALLEPSSTAITATGDLAQLLRFLEGGEARPALGDGSLIFLESESDLEAAEIVASGLTPRAPDDPGPGTVLLDPRGDQALAVALRSRGRACAIPAAPSPLRPVLQVLRLAFALRWHPFDPMAALQLLNLPVGPLPVFVARHLSAALGEAPGYGGTPWRDALARIEASTEGGDHEGHDESGVGHNQSLIETWLGGRRYPPDQGIPLDQAVALCALVGRWLRGRQSDRRVGPGAAVAARIADDLAAVLRDHGKPFVPKLLLDACLEDVTGEGLTHPTLVASGNTPVIRHPCALTGPVSTLVWWNFTDDSARRAHRAPWTTSEKRALARAGVAIDDDLEANAREERRALLALRWVGRRLVVVVPRRLAGVSVESHPLTGLFAAAFSINRSRLELATRDWLSNRDSTLAPLDLERSPIEPASLPVRQRWWHVRPDTLTPRTQESYSSLALLLDQPFAWVLRYVARISGGFLETLPDGRILLGSLAHRLLEELLEDEAAVATATQDQVAAWLAARTGRLLEEEGAVLLKPGRESDRNRLITATAGAAWSLLTQIRKGQWTVAGTEVKREGALLEGRLEGSLDLLLTGSDHRVAVIDMKWGGRGFRADQIRNLSSLQLCLYGHLVKEGGLTWPHLAYLIIESGELLHPAGPGGLNDPVSRSVQQGLDDYWNQMLVTLQWRRRQLDMGRIEVTLDGIPPDGDSDAPAGALPPGDSFPAIEYRALTGWTAPRGEP